MKSLFTLLFALTAFNAFAIKGPIGFSTALNYAGEVDSSTVEKIFINVKNGSGSSLAAGSLVVWDLTADDGATVTTSTTQTNSPACVIEKACSASALCSCQIYGKANVLADLGGVGAPPAVAGARFFLSATNAGYAAAITTPGATTPAGGIFYDSASATATVEVFIK
jgi:hypothetical protein